MSYRRLHHLLLAVLLLQFFIVRSIRMDIFSGSRAEAKTCNQRKLGENKFYSPARGIRGWASCRGRTCSLRRRSLLLTGIVTWGNPTRYTLYFKHKGANKRYLFEDVEDVRVLAAEVERSDLWEVVSLTSSVVSLKQLYIKANTMFIVRRFLLAGGWLRGRPSWSARVHRSLRRWVHRPFIGNILGGSTVT